MAIKFDYSRGGRQVSSRKTDKLLTVTAVLTATVFFATVQAVAQYPGQVTKAAKDSPELRSIAVLEWTGEAGKPKASRIVPVAVLDGGRLQDGGIYMARPEPMALAGEVEYQLEQDGKPIGLYDIKNAGQEQGWWVGYGSWKPMPVARPKPTPAQLAKTEIDDNGSDRPTLHRKKHAEDGTAEGSGGGGSTGENAPPSDPDRPTLHKKQTSDNSSDAGSTNTSSGTAASDDPERPVLKKNKKKQPEDIGHSEALPDVTDPDRPRLKRGKSTGNGLDVLPSLMGMPPDLQQAVAVSDSKTRPAHPWTYEWSNPDDEAKMKTALEDLARNALGLKPPPAPALPVPKRTAAKKNAKLAPLPPPPAPLENEQFRVFELAYGAGATLVLSAHTSGPLAEQKFVTLVAQPDLYGNVLVLLKSVTDGAHLDVTPRMRLVDAVDAMADNRGVLLFELRGATQRQFALYRVLRGRSERLFVNGGGEFGLEPSN